MIEEINECGVVLNVVVIFSCDKCYYCKVIFKKLEFDFYDMCYIVFVKNVNDIGELGYC